MFRLALSVVALAGFLAAAHYASAEHRAAHASVRSERAIGATEQTLTPARASARPMQHPLVPGATDEDTVPVGIGWG
jgi:hypothetical protein